jgi:hypothetical protein
MNDWLRALAVLGTAFVAVVATTLALAGAVVPGQSAGPTPSAGAGEVPIGGAPAATAGATPGGRPGIGGALTFTGDLEGVFELTRESLENRYALTGSDGRIGFEGQPVEVAQLSFQGWEFFPDPEDCTITPQNLDGAIGVGRADLVCTDLEEIRDKGTVSIEGNIGLPIDMLAERTLPFTGGTLQVGDEAWIIEEAFLFTWEMPVIGGAPQYNLELVDLVTESDSPDIGRLNVHYDIESHALTAITVERDGDLAEIPEGACEITREELGKQNPRTTVIEVRITCAEVEVPGLGPVPIEGTVVVDELAWPEA